MIDQHLITLALAGIGIAAAAAVLVSALILTVASGLRARRQHHAGIPVATVAAVGTRPSTTAAARREPALR